MPQILFYESGVLAQSDSEDESQITKLEESLYSLAEDLSNEKWDWLALSSIICRIRQPKQIKKWIIEWIRY